MLFRRRFYTETLPLVAIFLVILLYFQYYLVTLLRDLKVKELHDTTLDPRDRLRMLQQYNISPEMLSKRTGKNHSHLFNINITEERTFVVPAFRKEYFDKYSSQCEIVVSNGDFNLLTSSFPFRIYVYDLPAELTVDVAKCAAEHDKCFASTHCGVGERMSNDSDLLIHSTWQFSLESIIHHKMLQSPHRTLDPDQAGVFYIPYYGAMACFCHAGKNNANDITANIELLQNFLSKSEHFVDGKPHLLTISKIEREQATSRCPLLMRLGADNIRYIGIEQESNFNHRSRFVKHAHNMIVAPYPSYGHLSAINSGDYERNLYTKPRNIFLFLAASTRRSNTFRARILDQIGAAKTYDGVREYFIKRGLPVNAERNIIWLVTPECQGEHKRYTMEYMKHSVFCLQPPGDSPTRKSFYDALLSGCIPVLFKHKDPVRLPFQKHIPYANFTLTIKQEYVIQGNSIIEYLKKIPTSQVLHMQNLISKYIKSFQYSYPPSNYPHDDAIKMILTEVKEAFSL